MAQPEILKIFSTYRIAFDELEKDTVDVDKYAFIDKSDLEISPRSKSNQSPSRSDFARLDNAEENFGRTIQHVRDDLDIESFLNSFPRSRAQEDDYFGKLYNAYLNDDTLAKRILGFRTVPSALSGPKEINVKNFSYTGSQPGAVNARPGYQGLKGIIELFDKGSETLTSDRKAQLLALGGLDPNNSSLPVMTLWVSWCLWKTDILALKTGCSQDYCLWGTNVEWHDFTRVRLYDICVFKNKNQPGTGIVGFYKGFNPKTDSVKIIDASEGSTKTKEYSVKYEADPKLIAVRRLWNVPADQDNPVYYE